MYEVQDAAAYLLRSVQPESPNRLRLVKLRGICNGTVLVRCIVITRVTTTSPGTVEASSFLNILNPKAWL